eukprot:PITA_07936
MSNQESEGSIRPSIFDESNFVYWKVRTTTYLQSLGTNVWEIMEGGYTFPSAIPTDRAGKKQYETNAKAVNTLLGSLSQSKFVKVIQLKSAKEIWDKIVLSYEGESQVKRAKLQTLGIQYETLKMHNDESIANYFLRIDEIVNCMENLGEEIKKVTLVEKVLRSLSVKFESKVSAIKGKQDLQTITMTQLHKILTAFEMRKGGPSDMREAAFKASAKGKEELNESGHISEDEEEANFVKKLQQGSGRFRGKLPFKCFACGRVGHYVAKCPHKDKYDKGKESAKWNRKQSVSKKSYYTHEDGDGLSNSDEDENSNDYRPLMAYEDDDFLDALDENDLYEEISKLKICLEEKNMIIGTLTYQLIEREKHNQKLECEISSPLIKTTLGYTEETSQKLSTSTKSYHDATKSSKQFDNRQQRHKADHQVNQAQFTSRVNRGHNQPQVNRTQFASKININRNYNQQVSRFKNRRNFFNGQCFSCHNFGHKAAQCVAYKTIMIREARNQRNVTRIKKSSYNNFSLLENEIECSICNNFGHEESECKSKFQQIAQKEQTPLKTKIWKNKEPQTERCGIALYAEEQEN